jgi:acetyl-CoA acetyltransferase
VVLGTVIQEVKTSNLAREASLSASLPLGVPAHTVSMACISSNAAIASVAEGIAGGRISSGVAAGAETMSDVPIRLARPARALLLASQKVRGVAGAPASLARVIFLFIYFSTRPPRAASLFCRRAARRAWPRWRPRSRRRCFRWSCRPLPSTRPAR